MAKTINLDTSQRVDITCRKGDTFDLSLTLKDNASTPASVVADADTFKMEVRTTDEGGDAYANGTAAIILSTQDTDGTGDTKQIVVKDSAGTAMDSSSVGSVSYTHLTLPTTPYV